MQSALPNSCLIAVPLRPPLFCYCRAYFLEFSLGISGYQVTSNLHRIFASNERRFHDEPHAQLDGKNPEIVLHKNA